MTSYKHFLSLTILFFFCAFVSVSCSLIMGHEITIVDAKIVTALDENLMPVNIADVFPRQTQKVGCWLKWRDAKVNTQLLVKWHYLTDDIHIIDHVLNIPKIDGNGGVILSMPEGRVLPVGLYKVDLLLGRRVLRTLKFRVE